MTRGFALAILCCAIYLEAHLPRSGAFICDVRVDFLRDPNDCRRYYRLDHGQLITMAPCQPGMIFNTYYYTCVPRNSIWDDCRAVLAPTTGASSPSPETARAVTTGLSGTPTPASGTPASQRTPTNEPSTGGTETRKVSTPSSGTSTASEGGTAASRAAALGDDKNSSPSGTA